MTLTNAPSLSDAFTQVPGLALIPEFLSLKEEEKLLARIDSLPWLTDLKRRVQHYVYPYNYRTRRISTDSYLGPLPDWLEKYAHRLVDQNVFCDMPDQVIVNEYMPGQGISPHIDCPPCFKDTIVSLSLASACLMDFSLTAEQIEVSLLLPRRSIVVLKGEARWRWKHSIAGRTTDTIAGQQVERSRRVSITFRNVILAPAPKRRSGRTPRHTPAE